MDISQKIIDYAIWYYLKYYPSPRKLEQKLFMKFWPDSEKGKIYGWINKEEIDFILKEKLRNIIQEKEVIQSKIRNYKNKWKSKIYIKQKLFERLENRELIDLYLEEAFIEGEIDLVKVEYDKLLIKFKTKKWKIITEYDLKNKIIESLMRKWFKYDDIKIVLN